MAKFVKLKINAQEASPAPPVGPQIGSLGLSIMEFCKLFNEKSLTYRKGSPVSVVVTLLPGKKFNIDLKGNPTSYLIRERSSKQSDGSYAISQQHLEEIVAIKSNELNAFSAEGRLKIIKGTAKSMKVHIL